MAALTDRTAAPATSTAVQLDALRHDYGSRVALGGITFAVPIGQIFGLLGPNGSGKTTLFRILSTLMLPTGGRATIFGHNVVSDPNTVRRAIGVVFQGQSVDLKLTARENLWHQGHLYGLSGSALQQRITEMLQRVRLDDRAHDRAETFSGGMQRRLELAKGLMHSPRLLLLDEPTTGLDPGARYDLWQYLTQLRDHDGVTVIVTTHLMEEAEHCDQLAILNEGRLVALGTPAELKSEIGGDVILLEARDPATLAPRIANRFGELPTLLEGPAGPRLRLERAHGHRYVAEVVEAFPGEIVSVSVSKPTLEDVFIHRTGHRFWNEEPAVAPKGKKR